MYNRRKRQVLSLFTKEDELTARQVADALDISQNNSRNLLLHYFRLGLLHRRTLGKRDEKIYTINQRGLQRLQKLSEGVIR